MQRVGVTFCLLALAAIQVPWIVCIGCCDEAPVAALGEHSCHVHETPDLHDGHGHGHAHPEGCTCGHDPDEERGDREGPTGHLILQLPAVTAGAPVVLPPHVSAAAAILAADTLPAETICAAACGHDPPGEAATTPRGASERRLL